MRPWSFNQNIPSLAKTLANPAKNMQRDIDL